MSLETKLNTLKKQKEGQQKACKSISEKIKCLQALHGAVSQYITTHKGHESRIVDSLGAIVADLNYQQLSLKNVAAAAKRVKDKIEALEAEMEGGE